MVDLTYTDAELDDQAPPAVAVTSDVDPYAHLAQRAEVFVRDRGGSVHEDVLVAHVFGTAGSPLLWRPLLKQMLGRHEGLRLRADGVWTLPDADAAASAPLLAEFVALDVETTGLRPLRQRVIEIAAIRYRDGVEVERFETLCNPDKRIPKYIAGLTGITDTHVADAPRFADLADDLVRLVGSALVVGHNVGFDLGFVNAELKRLGRPPLVNDRLDTMALAMRFLPKVRKPNLDTVAQALELTPSPRKLHRAGNDARLAAEVAHRLAARAQADGLRTLDELKGSGRPERRSKDSIGRGRAVLDRSLLADIPKAPGVYLMRDAFDHIVYVGKAKNLRDRVASYYSQPLGYTRKMDGLLENLARIETVIVGSELEALLLECQLIRRYQPRYNTALRAFEHYPFIRVDVANAWPRLTLAKARRDDGARYFGPFRNKTAARKTVELVNRVVPLRTCSRSFKDARSYGSPCIELDLGRCLGPCVGRADREAYRTHVRDVVRFLDGEDAALYELLWRGLEEAADRLDFERARRLRDDLHQVNQVVAAQRRLRDAVETHYLLLVLPAAESAAREVLLVAGGRLWAQLHAADAAGPIDLAQRLERSWDRLLARGVPVIDHDSVDDANILNRWLYANAGHPAILPLPWPTAAPDWTDLARRALSLGDDELTFDTRAAEVDDPADDRQPSLQPAPNVG